MKLLWVSHFPVFGGPHNMAVQLAPHLAKAGVEVLFLAPTEPGGAADRLRAGGVETVQLPLHRLRATPDPRRHLRFGLGSVGDVRRERRLIRDRGIEMVLMGGLANPHTALAASLEGVPLVWQLFDSRGPRSLRVATMPLVRRYADAVMFNGKALVDLHCGDRPLDQSSFVFVSPVDTATFRPSKTYGARTRERLGVPSDALLVGTVANLNPMKGIEYFIRAAGLVYARRPDAWFLICGAEYETHRRYREKLDEEMRSSGVSRERFILTDEAPLDHYPALDVKLVTSLPRSEGTTTTAVEAMACGVPVVATDVGAVSEVVEDGRTGLVVPPLDPAAIAEATLRIAGDPELAARLGAEGRRHAVERYDAGLSAQLYLQAFAAAREHARSRKGRGRSR
jgi:glycosyltransferase involved in cell wall biosynthesis